MPAVNVSDPDKDYLEQLRKNYPSKKVPKMNELMHCIILFIKERENEFMKRQKNEQ